MPGISGEHGLLEMKEKRVAHPLHAVVDASGWIEGFCQRRTQLNFRLA
jgi:hypothetical protein